MRLATATPTWLDGIDIDLTELELLADLDPGLVEWDRLTPAEIR